MIGKLCDYGLEHWVRSYSLDLPSAASWMLTQPCASGFGPNGRQQDAPVRPPSCSIPTSLRADETRSLSFVCESLSFTHRYVPVGLLERLPINMNERAFPFRGRDELEVRILART